MRLEKARGPSAAAGQGDRATKMKGGGGPEIQYWENPFHSRGITPPPPPPPEKSDPRKFRLRITIKQFKVWLGRLGGPFGLGESKNPILLRAQCI